MKAAAKEQQKTTADVLKSNTPLFGFFFISFSIFVKYIDSFLLPTHTSKNKAISTEQPRV